MTQLIITESGSKYELDQAGKRIRRLEGMLPPTARQGADWAWRAYADLVGGLMPGFPLFIAWADELIGPAASPGAFPGTMTSRVVSVVELP